MIVNGLLQKGTRGEEKRGRPPLIKTPAIAAIGKEKDHFAYETILSQNKNSNLLTNQHTGLHGAWTLLQSMCEPVNVNERPPTPKPPTPPPPKITQIQTEVEVPSEEIPSEEIPLSPNSQNESNFLTRGIRKLFLIRKRSVGKSMIEEDDEKSMLNSKPAGNGPKCTGEVCLIQDSPYRILRAAECGNLETFKRLYFADPSRLEITDARGRRSTHLAAGKNKINVLKFILEQNADLNVLDNSLNTPLHVAVENEAVASVEFLLQNNVHTNLLNDRKQAPIHLAVELNRVKVLETLCKYREQIDVQQGGEHGRTAVHIAAIYDHEECARILVRSYNTPWNSHCAPNKTGLTQFGATPKTACNNGYYPIHEAAKNASSRTMEIFLQWGEARGCSREEMISFFDAEGNVPLHLAVHGGDIKAVELCLKSGAKISTPQHDLSTPVHLACAQGATDIVKLMFDMQPDEKLPCLASCDAQKMAPIHCAAMFDHPEVVEYLVSEGADINCVDKERRSPILLAASRGGWRTVRILIILGADIKLKEIHNRNVLHLIVMNGGSIEAFAKAVYEANLEHLLKSLLNEKDLVGCAPLHYASRDGQVKSLGSLLNLGACINLKNNQNESPLHFAARYGRYNTVRQLLDSDKGPFIINESDGEGLTPLHIASQEGHTRIVQLLLNRGALLHRDHLGRNPLHLAAMSGYTQTMLLLNSVHSHLLDQADKDGNTALHLATMENKPQSIVLLLSIGCKLLYNTREMSAIDYAIYYKYPEAALAMVTHAERHQEIMALQSEKHPCVNLALIASMPRVFEAVQDRCIIKPDCKKDSKSFYIKYSFSCLQSKNVYAQVDQRSGDTLQITKPIPLPALNIKYSFENYQFSAEKVEYFKKFYNDPKWTPQPLVVANAMVTHGRVELLAHPLSQKYLQMKWNSYGKYFTIFNLFLYLIFLGFVTIFVAQLMYITAEQKDKILPTSPPRLNQTNRNSYAESNDMKEKRKSGETIINICGLAILAYIGFSALREAVQMYQQSWHYLLDPFNTVSWLLYIFSASMTIPFFTSGLANVHFSSASVAAFLAWFNLLLYLQRFDQVGIYVVMFLEILQTLVKVLLVFSILIIAFGLALYILLSRGNHLAFENVPMSLMRTFAMMLGEIDFLGTYVYSFYRSNEGGRTLPYPIPTFMILGVFMVFMPILLMNLLIGLAVGDIESVRRNAQLKRLAMQVVLHTELERKLPKIILEKIDKEELIEYPNEHKDKTGFLDTIIRKWFSNPFSEEDSSDSKTGKKGMHSSGGDGAIFEELEKQKKKLRKITASLESQHQLIRLIVQKMEIKTEADDVDEGVSTKELHGGSSFSQSK